MGNSSSSACGTSDRSVLQQGYNCFQISNQTISSLQIQSENCCLIKMKGCQQKIGQLHIISTSLSSPSTQLSHYHRRHKSPYPLIEIYGVKQVSTMKSTPYCIQYYVINEIVSRLSQIDCRFRFQECLYLLFQTLIGYFHLYKQFGQFQITDSMIAIDRKGKVKVWCNQNFGENHPLDQKPTLYLSTDFNNPTQYLHKEQKVQQKIIQKIFQIINSKYINQGQSFQQRTLLVLQPFFQANNQTSSSFLSLLTSLSQYQQKTPQIFIPHKIILEQNIDQPIEERESLSVRLQKQIQAYQSTKDQCETNVSMYSTGIKGNTIRKDLERWIDRQKSSMAKLVTSRMYKSGSKLHQRHQSTCNNNNINFTYQQNSSQYNPGLVKSHYQPFKFTHLQNVSSSQSLFNQTAPYKPLYGLNISNEHKFQILPKYLLRDISIKNLSTSNSFYNLNTPRQTPPVLTNFKKTLDSKFEQFNIKRAESNDLQLNQYRIQLNQQKIQQNDQYQDQHKDHYNDVYKNQYKDQQNTNKNSEYTYLRNSQSGLLNRISEQANQESYTQSITNNAHNPSIQLNRLQPLFNRQCYKDN